MPFLEYPHEVVEGYHSSVFEFRIVPPPLMRSVRLLRILYLR